MNIAFYRNVPVKKADRAGSFPDNLPFLRKNSTMIRKRSTQYQQV